MLEKRFYLLALSLLAMLFCNRCLLTNEMGIKPLSSAQGHEVKDMINIAAANGFMVGTNVYHLTHEFVFKYDRDSIIDSLFTGFFAELYSSLIIDDGTFYSMKSVDKCLNKVTLSAALYTFLLIKYQTNQERLEKNALSGIGSITSCKLRETGRVIHVSDALSF